MSKKQWGNACWYLFHTLAEKIKPEYVEDIIILKNLIINVCYNLSSTYFITLRSLDVVNA